MNGIGTEILDLVEKAALDHLGNDYTYVTFVHVLKALVQLGLSDEIDKLIGARKFDMGEADVIRPS